MQQALGALSHSIRNAHSSAAHHSGMAVLSRSVVATRLQSAESLAGEQSCFGALSHQYPVSKGAIA